MGETFMILIDLHLVGRVMLLGES